MSKKLEFSTTSPDIPLQGTTKAMRINVILLGTIVLSPGASHFTV